jgi:hypothetical protein
MAGGTRRSRELLWLLQVSVRAGGGGGWLVGWAPW